MKNLITLVFTACFIFEGILIIQLFKQFLHIQSIKQAPLFWQFFVIITLMLIFVYSIIMTFKVHKKIDQLNKLDKR